MDVVRSATHANREMKKKLINQQPVTAEDYSTVLNRNYQVLLSTDNAEVASFAQRTIDAAKYHLRRYGFVERFDEETSTYTVTRKETN